MRTVSYMKKQISQLTEIEKRQRGFYWKWEFLRRNPQFQAAYRGYCALLKKHNVKDPFTSKKKSAWKKLPDEVTGACQELEAIWEFPYFKIPSDELTQSEQAMLAKSQWPKNHSTEFITHNYDTFIPGSRSPILKQYLEGVSTGVDDGGAQFTLRGKLDTCVMFLIDVRQRMAGIGAKLEDELVKFQRQKLPQFTTDKSGFNQPSEKDMEHYRFAWDHQNDTDAILAKIRKEFPDLKVNRHDKRIYKTLHHWIEKAQEFVLGYHLNKDGQLKDPQQIYQSGGIFMGQGGLYKLIYPCVPDSALWNHFPPRKQSTKTHTKK